MPDDLLAFAVTALVIELTPGPNMAYLALIAVSQGRRAGLAVLAGVALGLGLMGLATGVGLGVLIQSQPLVYQALRWAGVLYLLYLAWETWTDGDGRADEGFSDGSDWLHFRRGLITNVLNPKAALLFLTVLPEFLGPEDGITGNLVLVLVYVAVASAVHAAIVLGAGAAHGWLSEPDRTRRVRRGLAIALVGVAIWVLAKG